jgi:hypothetical protein
MIRDWKKYLITFLLTSAIFVTALLLSSWIDGKRTAEVRSIQDSLSLNILSSETQFNLLKEASCEDLFSSDIGAELGDLSDRLEYFESIGRGDDDDVMRLKKYYALLQIKDFILINSATKCKTKPITILYFYDDKCTDCRLQGEILSALRKDNTDQLRVYSFNKDLEVSAVRTLANIYKVKEPLPALVIKGKTYNGYQGLESIGKLVPEILDDQATTTATSTKKQ